MLEEEGSKRTELIGKRQITVVFAGSLSGDLLPIQIPREEFKILILLKFNFPSAWHVAFTANY